MTKTNVINYIGIASPFHEINCHIMTHQGLNTLREKYKLKCRHTNTDTLRGII